MGHQRRAPTQLENAPRVGGRREAGRDLNYQHQASDQKPGDLHATRHANLNDVQFGHRGEHILRMAKSLLQSSGRSPKLENVRNHGLPEIGPQDPRPNHRDLAIIERALKPIDEERELIRAEQQAKRNRDHERETGKRRQRRHLEIDRGR